jgi:hypothetical protein
VILAVSDCKINYVGMGAFLAALEKNTTLQTLSIDIDLSDESLQSHSPGVFYHCLKEDVRRSLERNIQVRDQDMHVIIFGRGCISHHS